MRDVPVADGEHYGAWSEAVMEFVTSIATRPEEPDQVYLGLVINGHTFVMRIQDAAECCVAMAETIEECHKRSKK